MDTNTFIQFILAIVAITSAILIYKTIKSNKDLNQKIIFNDVVRLEMELRIKLHEYKERIDDKTTTNREKETIKTYYETLLFNYYEYLAICLYKKLINEKYAKLYFKDLLTSVKDIFYESILFQEGYAKKENYAGIQWLFKKWKIN